MRRCRVVVSLSASALTSKHVYTLFCTGPSGQPGGPVCCPRYLGTLFGLTRLSHQIGGFFGAWLGGVVLSGHGNYMLMWYLDIGLALVAALAHLPIREQAPRLAAA